MSTSETTDLAIGPCPCGKGKLRKYITSQDNPWSSVDISYGTDCPVCAVEWSFSNYGHGSMTNNKSERPYREAYKNEQKLANQLHNIVDHLVDRYFADFADKPATVELREMHRLGIASINIDHLRKARRAGRKPSQSCYALRNLQWLSGLVEAAGQRAEFSRLREAYETAKEETSRTSKSIVRRSLSHQ